MSAVPQQLEPEPQDLSSLEDAALLKLLYRETRSARAQAIYQELVSRQAVAELAKDMKKSKWQADRERGPQTTKTNAEKMREDWRKAVIRWLLIQYASREQLVAYIEGYSKGRYQGKRGENIRPSTIRKWLTLKLDEQMRREVDRLRAAGITADTYEG